MNLSTVVAQTLGRGPMERFKNTQTKLVFDAEWNRQPVEDNAEERHDLVVLPPIATNPDRGVEPVLHSILAQMILYPHLFLSNAVLVCFFPFLRISAL